MQKNEGHSIFEFFFPALFPSPTEIEMSKNDLSKKVK